jgi:hypothetical protein
MSNYSNFVKVFPIRCLDLLRTYRLAVWADREVTLMLAVASAGLTVPVERLGQKDYPYPFKDRARYPKARKELDRLFTQRFCGSTLLPQYPKTWCFGRLATTIGEPSQWTELQFPAAMSGDETVKSVIRHLRNSLAHGSIHMNGDPISEIVFVASARYRSPDFNYLMVSPDDFYYFLLKWFGFLRTLEF